MNGFPCILRIDKILKTKIKIQNVYNPVANIEDTCAVLLDNLCCNA